VRRQHRRRQRAGDCSHAAAEAQQPARHRQLDRRDRGDRLDRHDGIDGRRLGHVLDQLDAGDDDTGEHLFDDLIDDEQHTHHGIDQRRHRDPTARDRDDHRQHDLGRRRGADRLNLIGA
jgi:hypothetical protein